MESGLSDTLIENRRVPKIVAVVQARMGSRRLPNKMMLHLYGYPVVGVVYMRLKKCKLIDEIVFAIPNTNNDGILASYLCSIGAKVYRGHESDVLNRFASVAKKHSANVILRICADNPLLSPCQIDHLISEYLSKDVDYAYNHIPLKNNYPDGLGAEITSADILYSLDQLAKDSSDREHIFNYLWRHSNHYRIHTFDPKDTMLHAPTLKLDLDTMDDYQRLMGFNLMVDSSDRQIVQEASKSI